MFSGLFDGTSDEVRFDGAASFLTRVERLLDPGPLPEVPSVTASETPDDTDDLDEPPELALGNVEPAAARALPAPGHLLDTAGAEARAAPTNSAAERVETATADSVASLFQTLRIEHTSDGGVRFEAPREAAASLIALFEGMAKLLSAR